MAVGYVKKRPVAKSALHGLCLDEETFCAFEGAFLHWRLAPLHHPSLMRLDQGAMPAPGQVPRIIVSPSSRPHSSRAMMAPCPAQNPPCGPSRSGKLSPHKPGRMDQRGWPPLVERRALALPSIEAHRRIRAVHPVPGVSVRRGVAWVAWARASRRLGAVMTRNSRVLARDGSRISPPEHMPRAHAGVSLGRARAPRPCRRVTAGPSTA
jgi:hypothetical protein